MIRKQEKNESTVQKMDDTVATRKLVMEEDIDVKTKRLM